ncbi:MAG: hypothetical protein L3K03_05505 [Thermoplasmata archaeon]|nr:hypothetical protein [Thermoplasmata archaeon]
MSAAGAARSFVSFVLLIVGVVLLLVAALDLLKGFGVVYCVILLIVGVIFLALSGRV